MLLSLAAYLSIIALLVSGTSESSNLKHFAALFFFLSLLYIWIIYWCYNEQRRLYKSLKSSGVLNFLVNQDFRIQERLNGWTYELEIQGYYNNSLVRIDISHEKGTLWQKYFLNLEGVPLSDVEAATTNGKGQINTFYHHTPVRLIKSDETLCSLKKHLSRFTNSLLIANKTTDNKM